VKSIQILLAVTTVLLSMSLARGDERSDAVRRVTLFEASEAGYRSVRVPSLAVMNDGTLLCFISGKASYSDWAEADVLYRVSKDHGRTWSDVRTYDAIHGAAINAFPIVDRRAGTLHLLIKKNYESLHHAVSNDHGLTFTPPRDVTATLDTYRTRDGYDWTVMAIGPGAGIQLKSGRLLAPIWLADSPDRKHRPSCVSTIYSDDGGATWQCGQIIARDSPGVPNPSEAYLVELADGRVMMNLRNESPRRRRMVATSPDGATGWTEPVDDAALFEPICQASLTALPLPDDPSRRALLFVNPDSSALEPPPAPKHAPRMNLAIRASLDDGRTWPVARVLDPGRAAYSDMAVGGDGRVFIAYESGELPLDGGRVANRAITFLSIDPRWLLAGATVPAGE